MSPSVLPPGFSPANSGGGFPLPLGPQYGVAPPSKWTQDQGVDIFADAHTPLLAVGSGTIVNHGITGFGPWAPILKLDQPIGGHDYVYYGHAGPGNMVKVGTHVKLGDVIGEVGAGIVGISTGPHLEIGFSDARGTPVPKSSGQILDFLKAPGKPIPPEPDLGAASGVSIPSPADIASGIVDSIFGGIASQAAYAGLAFVAIIAAFLLIGKGVSGTGKQKASVP